MKFYSHTHKVDPIYQRQAKEGLSGKYKLVRTDKIIDIFLDNGLEIVGQSVAGIRKPENDGFQRHLIAFSNDQLITGNGEQLQLLLTNSHDGRSSYQLDLGIFRFACANGIVHGESESTIRIRHIGNCLDRIDKAIQYQLDRLPQIAAQIDRLKQVELSRDDITKLTLGAAELRAKDMVIDICNIHPRRYEDRPNDLWTVFNRVQEASIRGGLRYKTDDNKWKVTRKLTAVDKTIKLNKALWNLAETFAKVA